MENEHGHEHGGLLHSKLFGLPAPIVLGGGALAAFFVLSHRAATPSGAAAQTPVGPQGLVGDTGAGAAQGLQQQLQQEKLGYQSALDKLNQEAARFSLTQQENRATQSAGEQAYSKGWQQSMDKTGWWWIGNDPSHPAAQAPGGFISEDLARQQSSQNKGPYAHGGTDFYSEYIKPIVTGAEQAVAQLIPGYVKSQLPVGLPNQSQPAASDPSQGPPTIYTDIPAGDASIQHRGRRKR